MFDDGDGWVGEFGGKLERGIGVVQIVVGQRLALKLCCRGDARPCFAACVYGGPLMRVLAIAEFLKAAARHCHGLAERVAGQPSGNGPVIGGGAGKHLAGKPAAGAGGDVALCQFRQHVRVVRRVADNRHEIMVLRRGAKHRRSTYVDIFHKGREIAGLGELVLERIEIDRQQVDTGDILIRHRRQMIVIVAPREEAAMDFRMQGLDPPVHDLGKAGHIRHVGNRDPGLAKASCRSACGQDFEACPDEAFGEGD